MKLLRWVTNLLKIQSFKLINGLKVHYTGLMSVDRDEAIRANWNEICKITKSFRKDK